MEISAQVSVSAMQAYKDALDVTANNVANANTDGFKRSSSVFSERVSGGVERKTVQDAQTVKAKSPEPTEPQETSDTDFAREATEMMRYDASAKIATTVFKTQSRMSQQAVDLIA